MFWVVELGYFRRSGVPSQVIVTFGFAPSATSLGDGGGQVLFATPATSWLAAWRLLTHLTIPPVSLLMTYVVLICQVNFASLSGAQLVTLNVMDAYVDLVIHYMAIQVGVLVRHGTPDVCGKRRVDKLDCLISQRDNDA